MDDLALLSLALLSGHTLLFLRSNVSALMGYPRKSLVCLNDTPYYHVIARCVRRAWLWGFDEYARRNYSHRKEWVIERLQFLSDVFAIDICAYAVMSNHYHLVVRVDRDAIAACSEQEIVERWSQLFRFLRSSSAGSKALP